MFSLYQFKMNVFLAPCQILFFKLEVSDFPAVANVLWFVLIIQIINNESTIGSKTEK